jgi:hypothetical protein
MRSSSTSIAGRRRDARWRPSSAATRRRGRCRSFSWAGRRIRSRVRNLLPDATYVSWQGVAGGITRARPSEKPVVPGTMDAYSQTELEPKLGVRDGTTLVLLGAPDGFGQALRRAELVESGPAQLVMLFSPSVADLERDFDGAKAAIAPGGTLWICWPKKASGVRSDLDQARVRRYAMDEASSTSRSPRSTRRGPASASRARGPERIQTQPVQRLTPVVAVPATPVPPSTASVCGFGIRDHVQSRPVRCQTPDMAHGCAR